jgi:hypothetical protein
LENFATMDEYGASCESFAFYPPLLSGFAGAKSAL